MKPKNNKNFLTGLNPAPTAWILIFVSFLTIITGCKNYYKVTTAEKTPAAIKELQKINRFFIIHQGAKVWHLDSLSLDQERKEISGIMKSLPKTRQVYIPSKPDGPNPYIKATDPTFEAHIYISEYAEDQGSRIIIPMSAITKIEIYDKDTKATSASHFLGGVGIVVGALVVLVAIVALTKSSCPFVYVSDGRTFHFTGEMFGGAIYPSLERHDFMPLPRFEDMKQLYRLKIANELLEKQYTNLAELIVIEHPLNSKIILDKKGNMQSMLRSESPLAAVSDIGTDYQETISSKDSISFVFNDNSTADRDLSYLILTFNKPAETKTGKLIINAKNSYWLDYVYGKFNEQFGSYFNSYNESQKKVPAAKNIQWTLDQGIPLSVYIETEEGWEFIDYFDVIGPLASRDMVMSFDVSRVTGNVVKIKLECGFMFWEMDYAAMDFSENIPVKITRLTPASAIDERGIDVSASLSAIDDNYLFQPNVGNEVIVEYTVPAPANDHLQSFFLHSRGYYEYIRDYKGVPNLIYLNGFKKKGSFTRFSRQRYSELINNEIFF